jgi:hypothetical protein
LYGATVLMDTIPGCFRKLFGRCEKKSAVVTTSAI